MKKLLMCLLIAMSASCATYLDLPLRVTGKQTSDSGRCYLIVKPVSRQESQVERYETPWHERYCAYEIGQEIK